MSLKKLKVLSKEIAKGLSTITYCKGLVENPYKLYKKNIFVEVSGEFVNLRSLSSSDLSNFSREFILHLARMRNSNVVKAPKRAVRCSRVCCCETHYDSYCGQYPSTFVTEKGHYINGEFVPMILSLNRR